MPFKPRYYKNEQIIDGRNWRKVVSPTVDGETKQHGLIPRDFDAEPVGSLMFASAFTIPIIPNSEWQDRLDQLMKDKAQQSDIRNDAGPDGGAIPSRDQNGKGYCLPPGALVRMADGTHKAIEQVRLGDEVLTNHLRPKRVLQTMNRLFTGDMVSLRVDGMESPLTTTGDHPVDVPSIFSPGYHSRTADLVTAGEKVNVFAGDRFCPRNVRSVGKRAVKDVTVFDIGVEDDHHFIAGDVLVHNCWAHSSVSAAIISRAVSGQPYADLSAYAIACIIKNYQDQGGWGSESMEFLAKRGVPTSEFWPQQSMSKANDKPATWENAALYKATEWMELDPSQMMNQLVTCLLLGYPVVTDFNWWSHSVCTIDLVSVKPFQTRILNSWGDKWSANGTGVLAGAKAKPDNALALIVERVAA